MHTIINLSITNQSVTSTIIYKLYDAYELKIYLYYITHTQYLHKNIVILT